MGLNGKKYAVFGLGKAGLSTCKFLLENGAEVYASDDNENGKTKLAQSNYKNSANLLHIGDPNNYPWSDLTALLLSPGVPLTHPAPNPIVKLAQKNHCDIICDIELLAENNPQAKYIGITGTNGKSTTTALTNHIFKHAGLECELGGNIGIPALDLASVKEDGFYCLELSSYQLDLIQKTRFNLACLLNITPDHLDRHGDMQGYIKAKLRIFKNQKPNDVAIIGIDDEYCQNIYTELKQKKHQRVIPISTQQPVAGGIYFDGATLIDDIDNTQHKYNLGTEDRPYLPGIHNAQNIAFAFAIAKLAGINPGIILNAVSSFKGLPHRIQYVDTINGVRFINDSKATNAEAAAKALACYHSIYWILGGKPKEGGISSLDSFFPRIAHAFLIGEAADEFAKNLDGHVPYQQCKTLDKAIKAAYEQARSDNKPAPVVLLSPACASFDQFPNFEVRGETFCKLVDEFK